MRDYNIAVSTSNYRSTIYVNDTLQALLPLNKEIHVFVDGDSDSYITNNSPLIKTHLLPRDELTLQNSRLGRNRAGYNMCRCLTFETGKDILVLEDDVVIKDDFNKRLEAGLAEIKDKVFLLSLSHAWMEQQPVPPKNAVIHRFVPEITEKQILQMTQIETNETLFVEVKNWQLAIWSCSQCVYYPSGKFRNELAKHIMTRQETLPEDKLYDFLIGDYFYVFGMPIYLIIKNAAEHIGIVRSIIQ
jgi:hypothetical protein